MLWILHLSCDWTTQYERLVPFRYFILIENKCFLNNSSIHDLALVMDGHQDLWAVTFFTPSSLANECHTKCVVSSFFFFLTAASLYLHLWSPAASEQLHLLISLWRHDCMYCIWDFVVHPLTITQGQILFHTEVRTLPPLWPSKSVKLSLITYYSHPSQM